MVTLFEKKQNCSACGACLNACPQDAIRMEEDDYGFKYPHVDESKCVECGRCINACNFQTTSVTAQPRYCYAAIHREKDVLLKSASGGVFGALAQQVLEQGGRVFGCELDENFHPVHRAAASISELEGLRGTKYVQSDIGLTYRQAKELLDEGILVLFSGTPCQIDGLYGFLGRDMPNLITIDLICHGVSSETFFFGYIDFLEKKLNGKIRRIYVRDKKRGWGMGIRVVYEKDGTVREKFIPSRNSSYLHGFLEGEIYRENCYLCKYASAYRVGDFTVGDYWGVAVEHPELFADEKKDRKNGVSAVLVNSEKGKALLDSCKYLDIYPTELKKIAAHNSNLVNPVFRDEGARQAALGGFAEKGYAFYDARFMKKLGAKKYINSFASRCPQWLRRLLRKQK